VVLSSPLCAFLIVSSSVLAFLPAVLLESWCDTIERNIGDRDKANTLPALAEAVQHTGGPKAIIAYWRNRMQKLTSIVEQLKQREYRIVVSVMTALVGKSGPTTTDATRSSAFGLIRRWKAVDTALTEAANEAKDNVKYLSTLSKFIEPLYTSSPLEVIDALPALMNSIKMIHTIARYFNSPERMTDLFIKITFTCIANCKTYILATPMPNGEAADASNNTSKHLWSRNVPALISRLEDVLKLNEAFQEDYRLTKESLAATPGSRRMDGLNEEAIFGKFDLFCRRVIKLIDTFATTSQFDALASHNLEGLEPLLTQFNTQLEEFKKKRHDLLNFTDSSFDRDYVEFNVRIGDLELDLQKYINQSFQSITSIDAALALLAKFQDVLQRDSMREDLDSKLALIFQTYGHELSMVEAQYDKHKQSPPIPS
jgi:dynein heavy chain